MNIHKLHIFGKNRDAIAAQKGYSFQQLKTLEDWLENRIAGGTANIYCEFEDDIFSHDTPKNKAKFSQIKLYATDFSFSSEAIQKAIAHFFSLFTKGEYAFDEVEFNFETNASIVGKTVGENDAALLHEWHEHQDNLAPALIDRIRVRIKKILDEYIKESVAALNKNVEQKPDVQQAQNVYNHLTDDDFDNFIRSIKWKFDGIDSNTAVDQLTSRIEELITGVPLPLDDKKTTVYRSLLVTEVFERSIKDDSEDRKLTPALLDNILLSAGDQEDQWYAETVEQFKDFEVKRFYPGEFQAVIGAARYARWNDMDAAHEDDWLSKLRAYIDLAGTPVSGKRKAIYEYLFLKIGHNPFDERKESAIAGDLDLVDYYFSKFNERSSLADIEDDITLLQLLKGQAAGFSLPVKDADITSWQTSIETYLDAEATKEQNTDRLCNLVELRGYLAQQADIKDLAKSFKQAFDHYRKILPLLEHAQFYTPARLYDQLTQMVNMLINWDMDNGLLDIIDDFSKELLPYADKIGQQDKTAEQYLERAGLHLEHQDLNNYLRALEQFHLAKALWRQEYTKGRYIASLTGLAMVYDGLGMTYASKCYALMAFWSNWHFNDPGLFKFLHKTFGLIQHADHRHGAWMNVIEDFNHYLSAKREFDEKGFDIYNDQTYERSVFEIATVLHAVPLIHPEMTVLIDNLKASWGFVWTNHIKPIVEELSAKIPDNTTLKKILDKELTDVPLNDVGSTRHIRFKALGIDWHIQFNNNESLTAIGEEFLSFLQITLTEIARIDSKLLVGGTTVTITVQEGHFDKQLTGPDTWLVTIPVFDSAEPSRVNVHYTYLGSLTMAILQNVSNLSKHDFIKFYAEVLVKKHNLADKVLAGASYQRMFTNSIGAAFQETSARAAFNPLPENSVPIIYWNYLSKSK
jgi:hypothetical protein